MLCGNFKMKLFYGGENVKPEKNRIFLKNGKTVNCQNNTGRKPRNFLDLG